MVLQDQYPILPSPLIVNKNLSASVYIGMMNGFGLIYFSNWIFLDKWGVMEVGTGLLMLSHLFLLSGCHIVVACSLVLWNCR